MSDGLNLSEVVGAPYIFRLRDNTELSLGEWTIECELWAKKHFGSMEKLFNALLGMTENDQDTINAAVRVAIYKLTPESKNTIRELVKKYNAKFDNWKEPDKDDDLFGDQDEDPRIHTIEDFFNKFFTYRELTGLCRAEYDMIKDSIPIEILEESKKKQAALLKTMESKSAMRKKKASKTTTKKKKTK